MGLGGVLFLFFGLYQASLFPRALLCWSVVLARRANLLHMCVWFGMCVSTSHERVRLPQTNAVSCRPARRALEPGHWLAL